MTASRTALSMVAAFLVTGCGAIMHGSRQNIGVQTSPPGVKIETAPPSGSFTTPTTLNLERKNSYVLTFTSPGYNSATVNLQNGVGVGTVIGDVALVFVGFVPGVVAVAVDATTGSWYGLNPENVNVTLTRATAGDDGPQEIHIRLREA